MRKLLISFSSRRSCYLLYKKSLSLARLVFPLIFSRWPFVIEFLVPFEWEKVISFLSFRKPPLPFLAGNPFNHHSVLIALRTKDLASSQVMLAFCKMSLCLLQKNSSYNHILVVCLCNFNKSLESYGSVLITKTGKTHHLKRYSHCISCHIFASLP